MNLSKLRALVSYLELEILAVQVRYSRYNTEHMLKLIKIIAKEKETMCAPHFIIWVRLLWVAMTRCYDTHVRFVAGAPEKPRFDFNITTNLKTFLIFT